MGQLVRPPLKDNGCAGVVLPGAVPFGTVCSPVCKTHILACTYYIDMRNDGRCNEPCVSSVVEAGCCIFDCNQLRDVPLPVMAHTGP